MSDLDAQPTLSVSASMSPVQPEQDEMQRNDIDVDEFGDEMILDDDLEAILRDVESQDQTVPRLRPETPITSEIEMDIEDVVAPRSPFEQFRRKGWLSVSDLVGTVWCEVQYDYRLRTLPFLPPSQRPAMITSKDGAEINVDKVKVEGKERILRRGEKIHKRLEREIHPEEIVVTATSREDVWGLRFLNMFSALEALLTLDKCRELPVVGFVRGILVMGVIDEITRKPVDSTPAPPETRSTRQTQTSLTNFFSPTKPRPVVPEPLPKTHKLFVSDSKTRASGTLPRESDTLAGRLQVMLYKEILDAMLLAATSPSSPISTRIENAILPTEIPFSFPALWAHLKLNPEERFSDDFVRQSRAVVSGNGLRFGAGDARTLEDMIRVWKGYVMALGLGTPIPKIALAKRPSTSKEKGKEKDDGSHGRTEERLELVYRRAGPVKQREKKRKGRRREGDEKDDDAIDNEEREIQLAIDASLKVPVAIQPEKDKPPDEAEREEREREEDEIAWAVEMSLGGEINEIVTEEGGEVVLRASQRTAIPASSPLQPDRSTQEQSHPSQPDSEPETPTKPGTSSGSIIGKHRFQHSPRLLAAHLSSVLDWWMGHRVAVGVRLEETRRCGWCEFEEGCEWRARKANEALEKARARQK